MSKRHFLLAAGAALCAAALPAMAQEGFPPRSITIVVGFAAGGAADSAARLIGRKLGEALNTTVVIDNKPGAGGNIAHQYVAKTAPADGSVILFGSVGPLTIAQHLMKLPYDPAKDFAPITMGVNFPNVLVVHSGTGFKTLADFINYAKANPGKLDYASTGPGSASHLGGELLDDMARIDTVHVPYKGGAPALQDLLAGRVASYYSTYATAQPHVEAGKLIPLAVTGPQRLPALPKVPTIAESGYPGYSATNWYAFVASSKVAKPILDRYNAELVKVLSAPDTVAQLNGHGLTPQPGSREDLAKTMERETATWGRIIRERKIKLD